jgi:DNA processing protein
MALCVVVKGAQYSGSLITSRLAMESGREVFGVPENVTEPSSFAPNQLIKQGAKLVSGWEDVVEELPTEIRAELFPVEATSAADRASLFEAALSASERKLHEHLRVDEAVHVDELVEATGLSSSETLAALCEMEMRGVIRQLPGKQFLKILPWQFFQQGGGKDTRRRHTLPRKRGFRFTRNYGAITGHRRIAGESQDNQ